MKGKFLLMSMFAATAWTLAACSGEKKDDAAQSEKPEVKVAQVESRDVEQIEEYTATVESDVKNNISSNAQLRIEKIYVEVGDVVSAGQVLVQMDASNLKQLDLQIKNLEVEFNRIDQLYKVGGASKSEWDNAKTQLDVNKTQLNNLRINTQLKSPVSGVVTARNYDNGDMTGSNPILTIEKLSPCKMNINVSEKYYPKMKVGMPVQVQLETYSDETFEGKVTIVSPTVDGNSHTFPVEITLPNNDKKIRPGMFARAIVKYDVQNRVLVPDESIVKQVGAGDRYVYVYKDGKVSYNLVKLGRHLGNRYEVIEGVEPGSQVVTAGQSRLANGVEVEVVK
jgi:RND family efflux transporter MFP subunit